MNVILLKKLYAEYQEKFEQILKGYRAKDGFLLKDGLWWTYYLDNVTLKKSDQNRISVYKEGMLMKKIIWCLMIVWLLGSGCFASPLSAQDGRGLTVEGEVKVTGQQGEEILLYKDSYALLIGISDYTEGWPDLPGVKHDIQAVKGALEEHGFHVTIAEDPSREQFERAFTEFINQYGQQPDNRLLFYFAGHGHTLTLSYGGEMGYIVPVDAPNPHLDESGFLVKAMDMQMIEVYAKRIQAKHAMFLFDSCFSGSIFALSRAVPESITDKTAKPVRQFITSGSAEELVPDESIFRQQLIEALKGEADVNGDGYITGTELGEFLQGNVVNYSKGAQHPQYGKIRDPHLDKGDFVFPVAGDIYVENIHIDTDTAQTVDPEVEMWQLVKDSNNVADLKAFLEAFPQGRLAKVGQLKLSQLERQQDQGAEPDRSKEGSTPTLEFFSDFEHGFAGFDENQEEEGGVLKIIKDPTGSNKGNVLKGTITRRIDKDSEYLIYPEKTLSFQKSPCRIQGDIWMSKGIYEDIEQGRSEWYVHFVIFDLADWDNDNWHVAVVTELWDDGYMHLNLLGEDVDDASYPEMLPDAPRFTPETWHTMTLEVDASGRVSFYQNQQLIAQGKLRPPSRNGIENVHGGPISAGASLRKGGYVLVDNFSLTCWH